MVWYLWLILAWWQRVQGSMQGGGRRSAFMWADEMIRQKKEEVTAEEKMRMGREGFVDESSDSQDRGGGGGRIREEGDTDSATAEEGISTKEPKEWQADRIWTTDHVRRILTSHSERLTGTRITTSAWRQIAVAMARRYLGGAFGHDETGGEGEDEEYAEMGIEDDALDLQLGHGSRVAGMIYARESQQATFGTARARDQFRAVSRGWQRFLGIGGEDQKTAAGGGRKRRREAYEAGWDETRVIQAIMQEAGPFVQMTGTGGGKSLSFMLPADCAPGGRRWRSCGWSRCRRIYTSGARPATCRRGRGRATGASGQRRWCW